MRAPPAPGSLAVPGALVAAFPSSSGLDICVGHDCPPSQLARYTRGTAALGDQQVELIVSAEVQLAVHHD